MKRFLLAILFVFLLSGYGFAQNIIASGLQSSSVVWKPEPTLLSAILILTDGTNAATVTIYDSATENTGAKVVWKNKEAGANNYGGALFNPPLKMDNGVYITISGTGASFIAYEYKK